VELTADLTQFEQQKPPAFKSGFSPARFSSLPTAATRTDG
jgi:hypothetical protein